MTQPSTSPRAAAAFQLNRISGLTANQPVSLDHAVMVSQVYAILAVADSIEQLAAAVANLAAQGGGHG